MIFSSDSRAVASAGSINWSGFVEDLRTHTHSAAESNNVLALIIVEIRQLGICNSLWGFDAGEFVVQDVQQRLTAMLKNAVTVERIAPGRIALIVTDIAIPELISVSAQKMINGLSKSIVFKGQSIKVDVSLGISIFPQHGASAESLLCEAELALETAVSRTCAFYVAENPYSDKYSALFRVHDNLQQAIANENLGLNYQPKFDLKTRLPVASEALMRWNLPDGGRVHPEEFIPVAEASGIIEQLTDWVINTALREIAELDDLNPDIGVAVNVSATSIYDPAFILTIESALAIWGVPPQRLTLEITETLLMQNPRLCFSHLSQLRELGVKVSIDDFGTGFSSLSYFKIIPADEIKIDQSFVKAMNRNSDDEKIVESIIRLAHNFGHKVVAEGIENNETLDKLEAMGCDVGQGYLLAKPMAMDKYRHWLTTEYFYTGQK
ncbi:MAG: putative bifunctional diguanylate cyclase/phosphodiesterase [Porticoccaceae bacterium]